MSSTMHGQTLIKIACLVDMCCYAIAADKNILMFVRAVIHNILNGLPYAERTTVTEVIVI